MPTPSSKILAAKNLAIPLPGVTPVAYLDSIACESRQLTAEQLQNSTYAEIALAHQEIAADFLTLWKTETCPTLKQFFAEQYRRVVGVDPSSHDELRRRLEAVRAVGDIPVTTVVASFNPVAQASGFSPDSRAAGTAT